MSGLLDSIVRRRRASASSRLGPPEQNGHPYPHEVPLAGAPDQPAVNGHNGNHGHDLGELVTVNGHDLDEQPTAVFAAVVVAPEDPATPPEPEPEAAAGPSEESEDLREPALKPDDHTEPAPEPAPGFRQRNQMRRRVRYLRSLREVQLRDIGGFLLELQRFGRERGDLVQAKLASAAETDGELRTLERTLGAQSELRELREPGIGGACLSCGAVHGSQDRFCASCGAPLHQRERAATPVDSGTF